jgi:hypothetical protein
MMKKVYNYITIVKEGHDLKLGKNCGISCNRRNIMDKAHKRPTEIIAAINFPNMLESTLDRVIAMARTNPHIIVSLYCGTWTRSYLEDVELALDRIEEIAKGISNGRNV